MRVLFALLSLLHIVYGEHCMVTPDANGHVNATALSAALNGSTVLGYPDESTTYPAIDEVQSAGFYSCQALKTIEIPSSVETIGSYAFYNSKLTSVAIPSSVKTIRNAAFEECKDLVSVDFSHESQLTSIGEWAFYDTGLTSVILPDGLEEIGDNAYKECTNLNSVVLPDGLTTIGASAFEKSVLTSVVIPSSVTEIKNDAFWDCHDLVSVDFSHAVNLTTVGDYAFQDTRLVAVDLSKTALTKISKWMFEGCITLTSVIFPDDLTEISEKAFHNTNLTSVTIPWSVVIGADAFPSTTNVAKSLSRSYFDQYIAEGMSITQIAPAFTPEELSDAFLSSASPEELKAAYRAQQSCPN